MSPGEFEEKMRWIFSFFDKDGDGVVTVDELKALLNEIKVNNNLESAGIYLQTPNPNLVSKEKYVQIKRLRILFNNWIKRTEDTLDLPIFSVPFKILLTPMKILSLSILLVVKKPLLERDVLARGLLLNLYVFLACLFTSYSTALYARILY